MNNWLHLPTILGKIQVRDEIFDLHSHIVMTRKKIIEIPIPKEIIKHIYAMATCEKFTFA